MEVPRLRVELELQLLVYATATAIPDPSCTCDLHHSSRQRWILNPLRPGIVPASSWILVGSISAEQQWELQSQGKLYKEKKNKISRSPRLCWQRVWLNWSDWALDINNVSSLSADPNRKLVMRTNDRVIFVQKWVEKVEVFDLSHWARVMEVLGNQTRKVKLLFSRLALSDRSAVWTIYVIMCII